MTQLPAKTRLSGYYLGQADKHLPEIRRHVRMTSATLVDGCAAAGMNAELATVCGGLLASVADDLIAVGSMKRNDFARSVRIERVLALCDEPCASGLRLAIAANPAHGRAIVRHWDTICDQREVGMLAWRIGLDTDSARDYGIRRRKAELTASK